MSFTGDNLEQYLRTSRENHQNFFDSGRIAFSENHILFKTPEFYEVVPAHLDDKMCLDVPFDIGLYASVAINHPHFHCLHFDEETNSWKQVYLVKVDLPIGINIVNGQAKLNAAVICLIVKDYETGHDTDLYVHTLHLRINWNKFLNSNLGRYVQLRDPKLWCNHRKVFRGPNPHPFLQTRYDCYHNTKFSIHHKTGKVEKAYTLYQPKM